MNFLENPPSPFPLPPGRGSYFVSLYFKREWIYQDTPLTNGKKKFPLPSGGRIKVRGNQFSSYFVKHSLKN